MIIVITDGETCVNSTTNVIVKDYESEIQSQYPTFLNIYQDLQNYPSHGLEQCQISLIPSHKEQTSLLKEKETATIVALIIGGMTEN